MSALRTWSARTARYRNRAEVAFDLLLADTSWHLGGGRRRAPAQYREAIENHRWCFIVGCNNSGTSLLQGILENSAQVSTFPHEGQRYTRALRLARKRGHERVWSEYLEELRLDDQDYLPRARRLAHDWMRKLRRPVREMIVEKTTANAVRMCWLQSAFPRSYFIGLVRNGFAVAEGIRRKGYKTVDRAARHWRVVNELMLSDALHIDRFTLVKYEDLAARPETVAVQLADFLDLDAARLAEATRVEYGFETVKGGVSQSISNMNRKSLSFLSDSEIETIWRHAGPMLERFGYTADGGVTGKIQAPRDGTYAE